MKTTVRDFILDNMTDVNFEKLVHNFITNSLWDYDDNYKLIEKATEALDQIAINSKDNTFEVLNEIKKMSCYYIANHKNQFLPMGMSELNDPASLWKMRIFDPKEERELEIDENFDIGLLGPSGDVKNLKEFFHYYPQLRSEPGYYFFDEIKFPYCFSLPNHDRELLDTAIDSSEVDENNYLDYIEQEKRPLALGLANFIYEVLHYTPKNKSKIENDQFAGFAHEESLVKIVKDNSYNFNYCVHFFIDNRTRYISEGTHKAYKAREADYGYNADLEVIPPGFTEFEALYEDLSSWDITNYILEPFTNYLNEQLTIPKLSEGALYDVFEQLITLLTIQGFTKLEQIQKIISKNKDYEKNFIYIHML